MLSWKSLGSGLAAIFDWASRPVPRVPVEAPRVRVRRDRAILDNAILERYARDHKSGIKRLMALELIEARGRARRIPEVLFDGVRVWGETREGGRTGVEAPEVSLVLDATVRLMRKDAAPQEPARKEGDLLDGLAASPAAVAPAGDA